MPSGPAIPLLGIHPEELEEEGWFAHGSLHTTVNSSIIYNTPQAEATQVSIERGVARWDRLVVAYCSA